MDASVVAVEEDGPNDDGCYWHEVRAVLDALVSGARYGVKIRLPHAFVMTFMFRRDLSTRGKLKAILRAVSEHARTLGSFALVYKTVLVGLKFLQRKYGKTLEDSLGANALGRVLRSLIVPNNGSTTPEYGVARARPGRPEHKVHALLAGAVGGYLVWGNYTAVSHQVLFYVSIRVLAGLWKCLPLHDDRHWRLWHRVASTVAWALVMYLWEATPDSLQPSLRKSMDEIYDSESFVRRQQRR